MLSYMKLFKRQISVEETPPEDDREAAIQAEEAEVKHFWESKRDWFSEKGYTLFKFECLRSSIPLLDTPSLNVESSEYPYAFCGGDLPYPDSEVLEAYNSEKVCFAQDQQGRHVSIKKLSKEDETRIYHLLFEKRKSLAENSILPIIEILEYKDLCFVVTPRWGDGPFFCGRISIRDILHYIRCLLKAIYFLHSNCIVHRVSVAMACDHMLVLTKSIKDLKDDNTLVNHFGAYCRNRRNEMRPKLRSAGKLTYVLFDFDLALLLPSTECRLPSRVSFYVMTAIIPFDTSHGELDYDPYKFEMGCLGIFLCETFQHYIPSIPFLAPLFDRLITDKLELRFTAEEALQFFDQMHAKLSPQQLSLDAPIDIDSIIPFWEPEKHDRWEGLPEEFVKEWGHFRAPKPSLYTRFLRRISLAYSHVSPTCLKK
ncbi:hypothetical protein Clacol_002175 [Clathrus columnatus]|uniref:Protein kinase domain-containing protein n=1 Tax=Clathrus columnatus TaxID=1419009 RepID=A0AAV5A3B6_9AGAM|nr:hypothetical protein Clacol_002175 [Clathrus columnatus]